MTASMHPAEVSKAGKAAQHIADTMVKPAYGELGSVDKDEGGAHLKGFSSKASLDTLVDAWQAATSGLQTNVHGTGDKLIRSANTYITHDDKGVDLFKYVPPPPPRYGNHHPMPR